MWMGSKKIKVKKMLFSLKNLTKLVKADKRQRNIYKYKLLNDIAHRYGWRLYSPRFSLWEHEEYNAAIKADGYTFNDKKFMIYQLAKGVANLSGDTAACGVFKGQGSWLITQAGGRNDRQHHIFDSFEGVSEPLVLDNHPDAGKHGWKKHDMSVPYDIVQAKFNNHPQVKLYKGWIPERFSEVADRQFSFVHIDVDLYEPTRDSVAFFYDKMQVGGIILCDDDACPGTPGAMKGMDEFFADKRENVVTTVAGSGFVVKQ